MLAMVSFGFGEVFGCFFLGVIIDRFGSRKSVFANIILLSITTLFTLIFLVEYDYDVITFVMTFAWGFQDSAINTHTQQMLGFEF